MAFRYIAAVLITACIAGCVSFRSGKLAPTEPWPLRKFGQRPSATLVISGRATSNGNPGEVGKVFDLWCQQTERAYRESGLFSSVAVGLADSDLRAEVAVAESDELNELATAFTFLTVGVFPGVVTNTFTLHTEIKDRNGRTLKVLDATETSHMWIALVLLPAAALKSHQSTVADIIYDLNRTTLTELQATTTLDGQ
jgi:hypothetical protein